MIFNLIFALMIKKNLLKYYFTLHMLLIFFLSSLTQLKGFVTFSQKI